MNVSSIGVALCIQFS